MTIRIYLLAGFLVASTGWCWAQSRMPTISSAWDKIELSQDECLAHAEVLFKRKKLTRIERVGNTVFADRGNMQFGIRCVAENKIFYVFGGAPANDDRQLEPLIKEIRDDFNRR